MRAVLTFKPKKKPTTTTTTKIGLKRFGQSKFEQILTLFFEQFLKTFQIGTQTNTKLLH